MRRFYFPEFIALLILSGCAVLDPNNIIGRHNLGTPAGPVPVPATYKDESWRPAALDYVWTTVNERYYDSKLNGVDWKAVRRKYEPVIMAAGSDDDYWEALDRMAGELKDAHTRVQGPKQVAQQRDQEAHTLGLTFLEMNGALVVTTVHPDSDAYWAGVRAGMTIIRIEGEPALARYHRLMTEVRDTSTPWARTRGALRKITAGDIDTSVTMTFARAAAVGDTNEITATMKRRKFRMPSEMSSRVLPSGFAYVRFSNFVGSMEDNLLAAIDRMKDTPGMIVDLRNNGGGSLSMANTLITKFLSEKTKGARVLTRNNEPITVAFIPVIRLETELDGDKESAYRHPLVILINENSASASEVFTSTLHDLGRATVIGQRSCGCLLGYLGYADLPGGGQLAYSEIGFVSPKGKRIEGEGVKPDREIKLAHEDILYSRDRTLEAAEAFLKTKDKK
ncbi:MAG: S41 family peptidase [Betaproteobacteria bacterium]